MSKFYTTGQIARRLRISVSTLKRWIEDPSLRVTEQRNYNGWRLFSDADLGALTGYKKQLRRNGKRFNETVLIPVIQRGRQVENFIAVREGHG
jgi:DNA-binding transcriptional MerR regulator